MGDDDDLTLWSVSQPPSDPCSPYLEHNVFSRVETLLVCPVRSEPTKVQARKLRVCFQFTASLLQGQSLVWGQSFKVGEKNVLNRYRKGRHQSEEND